MPGTSVPSQSSIFSFGKPRRRPLGLAILPWILLPGCAELVHEGQVSDREMATTVNDVRIEQQLAEGGWKLLGHTDGRGRWWILKDKISGAGKIRLSKPGYHPVILSESEFLQSTNLLILPDDAGGTDPWR